MIAAVGKHLYEAAQALYQKAGKKAWSMKPFTAQEKAAWQAAVLSAQKELKAKKRQHPGLYMLATMGKHLYETPQGMYSGGKAMKAAAKTKRAPAKVMKAMKARR